MIGPALNSLIKLAKQFLSYSVSYGINHYSKNRNLLFIICWNSLSFSKQSDFYCPNQPDFRISKNLSLCLKIVCFYIYTHSIECTNQYYKQAVQKPRILFSCSNSVWIQKKKIQITNKTLKKLWVSQGITINSNNKGEYQHKGIYVFCKVIDILHPLTVI